MVLLPEFLSALAEYRLLFVGVLLLVVLVATPRGVVGEIERRLRRVDERPARAGELDVAGFLSRSGRGEPLAVTGLSVSFGGVVAVDGVSLRAEPGAVTSIIGPNGAGKTSVLNLVCGYLRPEAGSVRLGDGDVTGRPAQSIARAGIARTYQTTQLFENLSVRENLEIALRRGRLGSIGTALAGWPAGATEDRDTVEGLLAFVGYTGPVEQIASALPHVDKRLVEIARALAIRPAVLLLDEPAAGLGHQDTADLGRLLRRIADAGVAVVIVEHDMALVMEISNHVYVLDAGACIAEGPPSRVRADPQVREAYLGARDFASERRERDAGRPSAKTGCSKSPASPPATAPRRSSKRSRSTSATGRWPRCSARTGPGSPP